MSEPILILKTDLPAGDTIARKAWFERVRVRSQAAGVTWFRISSGSSSSTVGEPLKEVIETPHILFEGWKDRPENDGEPRWSKAELFP